MNRLTSVFFYILLIIVIGLSAYYLGKRSVAHVLDKAVLNNALIQQIAELSSLEVHGNASIKSSNINDGNDFADTFRKFFLERTVNITVPYIAKYGIELEHKSVNIEEKDKRMYIVLPSPKLLSYEVRLDKAKTVSKKGILESIDEQTYDRVIQKLYSQSKTQLENNQIYKDQSKEKIKNIIEGYYAPLGYKVDIVFVDELKSKVLDTEVE